MEASNLTLSESLSALLGSLLSTLLFNGESDPSTFGLLEGVSKRMWPWNGLKRTMRGGRWGERGLAEPSPEGPGLETRARIRREGAY